MLCFAGREFGQRVWCYAIASATVDALRNAPPSEEMIGGDPDPLPPVVARGEKKRVELLEKKKKA